MPAFAFPAEAGTHLPTPEGWKAEMALGAGWLHTEINVRHRELNPDTVAHLSTNRARRRLTLLIESDALTTTPDHHYMCCVDRGIVICDSVPRGRRPCDRSRSVQLPRPQQRPTRTGLRLRVPSGRRQPGRRQQSHSASHVRRRRQGSLLPRRLH